MDTLTFLFVISVVPGYSCTGRSLADVGVPDREVEWRVGGLTPVSEGRGETWTWSLTPERDYERGLIEKERTAAERASEGGLTDPAGRERREGVWGEVTLAAGFGEGDEGKTPETKDGEAETEKRRDEDDTEGEPRGHSLDGGRDEGRRRGGGRGSPDPGSRGSGRATELRAEGAENAGRKGVERHRAADWEERERRLVAGIGPFEENGEEGELEAEGEDERQRLGGERGENEMQSGGRNKKGNIKEEKETDEVTGTRLEGREEGAHTVVSVFTPLTASSPAEGGAASPTTRGPVAPPPPTAPPPPARGRSVLPAPPVNLPAPPTMMSPSTSRVPSSPTDDRLLLQLPPIPHPVTLSTLSTPTSQVWGFVVSRAQAQGGAEAGRSVALVGVSNVNGSPGERKEENDYFKSEVLEVNVGPTATVTLIGGREGVKLGPKESKPAAQDVETTRKTKGTKPPHNQKETNSKPPTPVIKPKKTNIMTPPKEAKPKELRTTVKSKDAKPATQDQKSTSTPKSKESNSTAKPVKPTPKSKAPRPTGKPTPVKSIGNETRPAERLSKANVTDPIMTRAMVDLLLQPPPAARTTAVKPSRINRTKKTKTKDKTKGKKGRKANKTKKPAYFPYFKDNYCPPECACYGRVVQCSDKGVDKIPYGVPFNARYILLMNNRIDSIQLDLLKQYRSMEFLVLSNNRLTDGTIEGALEGVPALKRLYLDRNLLESVSTDLPASLEELRLDNNRLKVMSEAAWERCPGLLVLSLSNNSLGNGSESLATGVLSPLANLRTLSLDYNQLESVPLGLPLSIKELYLRGNLIKRFRGGAFSGTSELVVLDLSANRLTNKGLLKESLLNATHLESLNLEGNRLKQVPRHLPASLKTLNLEGNLISSISKATFNTLSNLEHLGLARNRISRVAPGAFRTLPALHQLDLCHNALRQVPRQLPRALYSAALTHNRIESVPRDAFCWGEAASGPSSLVRVQLEHNLIDLGHLDTQAFRCLRGFQVVHFY